MFWTRLLNILFIYIAVSENPTESNNLTNISTNKTGIENNTITNLTLHNGTSSRDESTNKTHKFVQCLQGDSYQVVQITNDTELIKLLQPDQKIVDREAPAPCVVVLFYSKFCPFSSMAAPHFNALQRAFPYIKMVAINAMMYHLFNTQNGIVGVPSLLLFHNGRSIAKFNGSEYTLELFSQFITKHTDVVPVDKSTVNSIDFWGPVTSVPSKESDMFLIISWLFITLCTGYYFTKSRWWKWIIETIQSNWRESEAHAQHDHNE